MAKIFGTHREARFRQRHQVVRGRSVELRAKVRLRDGMRREDGKGVLAAWLAV